jgi:hypothetical protein
MMALFIELKKAYDSVWREILYNILIRVWGTHETSQSDQNVFFFILEFCILLRVLYQGH